MRRGGRPSVLRAVAAGFLATLLGCASGGAPGGGMIRKGATVDVPAVEAPRKGATVDVGLDLGAPEALQGDAVRCRAALSPVQDNAFVVWRGSAYPMLRSPGRNDEFQAVIGVDLLEPPGRKAVSMVFMRGGNETRVDSGITVAERSFPVQALSLKEEKAVFDNATLTRIAAEAAVLAERFARPPSPPRWELPFLPPLPEFRPRNFGARRVINGVPRAPHAGADITAPDGTPVRAIAGGTVLFAGDQFFGGRSVVLDHGGGLASLYYHLREYSVAEGEVVARGQRIGSVGSTGRATGPHLHFGIRAAGGRIDPGGLPGLEGIDPPPALRR